MQIDKSSDRSTDGWRDVDIEIIMPDSQMCVSVRSQEWNSTWLLFCMTSDTLSHSCHAFSPQGGEWGEERWSIDKKPCNTHWAITCVWDHTSALCRSVYLCTYTHTHTHTHTLIPFRISVKTRIRFGLPYAVKIHIHPYTYPPKNYPTSTHKLYVVYIMHEHRRFGKKCNFFFAKNTDPPSRKIHRM